MDAAKLRAWWWHKQGLDGSLAKATPAKVLEACGWARSVGGSNAYLTLFARAGINRAKAEKAVADLQIHELPCARGCTYFVPASDFALALRVGQSFGEAELTMAKKNFGFTDKELDKLSDGVLKALKKGPLDPKALKDSLGALVRNFGDEGKKRGLTTSLPIALGRLQSQGHIRRVPHEGRLDVQKFAYTLWEPSPIKKEIGDDEAFWQLAKRFLQWTGGATVEQVAWFSGLGKGASKKALESIKTTEVDGYLMLPEDAKAFKDYKAPKEKSYSLVAGIDSLFLLRRDVASFVDDADKNKEVFAEKGFRHIGHLLDLPSHAILDRGRLVGLWEFEPSSGTIAWLSFIKPDSDMKAAVAMMEKFVADDLGDARSFSLDSAESRKPRIAAMRKG